MLGDWHQLWEIASAPDNVPIVALLFLVPFYVWYAFRQARANDELIEKLEADPAAAKTAHRKTQPWHPKWDREVHTWPYLMRVEFVAAILVTVLLMAWSLTLNAPLEEPSNPNLTMNPAKAPWYFLGLQEMLVYFDPWMAGVVLPTLIIVGLMAIPYMDANPLGNGYYTYKQRRFALWAFGIGFLGLWVLMVMIGTFIRGPGWMWFWPGQWWDHNRVIFETNRDLPDLLGVGSVAGKIIVGVVALGAYGAAAGAGMHKLFNRNEFNKKIYQRMTFLQVTALNFFLITMMLLPAKMILRHLFRIKYLLVTPWFNI